MSTAVWSRRNQRERTAAAKKLDRLGQYCRPVAQPDDLSRRLVHRFSRIGHAAKLRDDGLALLSGLALKPSYVPTHALAICHGALLC
ncbi:MAG TPA: hypothetical protein VKE42_01825 [Candidatus Cybelea sp.]|nr:hypothetical protein [Candidatus Cybelea sp.]